ncbi:MAG: hypothetical protein KY468_16605 [Armatimonadetes bacterium]|nr:hypothetical protein [Armatimonadota bacterium]
METIVLNLKLTGRGWLEVCVGTGNIDTPAFCFAASYLHDSPQQLVESTLALLRGLDRTVCLFEEEPGEVRWIMERTGNHLSLKAIRFDNTHSRQIDEEGESVFAAECSLLRFATHVLGQMKQLFNVHGEQEYNVQWGHDFPVNLFQQLQEEILRAKYRNTTEGL